MSDTRQVILGLLGAALLPAAIVGVSSLAPLMNNQFVSMIDGRILTLGWWVTVPLSVAAAVIWTRRAWAGIVLGVMCIFAFVFSLALADTTPGTADLMLDPAMWVSTIVMLAVPWALGMIFGTTALRQRPKRLDGASPDGGGSANV